MRARPLTLLSTFAIAAATAAGAQVVDTRQTACFDDAVEIPCPGVGGPFRGQDAQHAGNRPRYTDNGDGTVSDLVTGLMWQQSPDLDGDGDIDAADKRTYAGALAGAAGFTLAGYQDWRLPSIKELYSLIDFRGVDPSSFTSLGGARPFIDTEVFAFAYGDPAAGDRIIDAQFASSTLYVSTTMGGNTTMFGVNFADGRIKGYPATGKGLFVLYVRGRPGYGESGFVDNRDGTITDRASGLMWAQDDSGTGMDWEAALAWVESLNAERYLGYCDWRLPDAKELQSLVDYRRSPDTTGSAAIDPLFSATAITNEGGQVDYPFYWTSTTHARDGAWAGSAAVYVAFGRALGYMNGHWMDVHGAGAQRSDPKTGDPADFPYGRGPQGDAVRIDNFVRPVRNSRPSLRSAPESAVVVAASTVPGTAAAVTAAAARATSAGSSYGSSWAATEPDDQLNTGEHRRPPTPPVETALDANGDAVLDARELAGAAVALATLDANGDGRLSRDECVSRRPDGGRQVDARGVVGAGGPSAPVPPVLAALDVNRDGVVEASELAGAASTLRALDHDGDGRLTPAEYRPRRREDAGRRAPPS